MNEPVRGSSADMAPFALQETPAPGPTCPRCGSKTEVIGELRLSLTYLYYKCLTCRHVSDTRWTR